MKPFTTSAKTLLLIREIARIEFRELNASDRAAFADAPADALIGFGDGGLAFAMHEATGEMVVDRKDAVAVLIAGSAIEAHAGTAEGDCVCIAFDLQSIA